MFSEQGQGKNKQMFVVKFKILKIMCINVELNNEIVGINRFSICISLNS